MTGTRLLLGDTLVGLAAGGVLHLVGLASPAHGVWAATTAAGVIAVAWWVVEAVRQRRLGADVLALLALVGTLLVGEYPGGHGGGGHALDLQTTAA